MTLEQQVAQLMVVRVPLDMNGQQQHDFESLLLSTEVGGVCFFVGKAPGTLQLIRRFQSLSRVPLLVCIDAEWGLGMRLKDCYAFPRNDAFGHLPQAMDTLAYAMGAEIGRQCRMMGIQVNFAPVVDVNSNPLNPVIGTRSFSDDPERVSQLGIQYMRGLQSQGVMAVAKHFPGHGDTKTDSHVTLPVINHSQQHMDSIELLPFRRLIDAGVEGVMTAHLQVNAFDSRQNRPASLSDSIVNGLLREKMGFQGMVFTDGLDMKGVTLHYADGRGELEALLAGNDFLLLPHDAIAATNLIAQEARNDDNLRQLVEMRCRRVLQAKYRHGCAHLDSDSWHVPRKEDSLRCADIVRSLRVATTPAIDSIVQDAIERKAFPGCQILVLENGKVRLRAAYGHLTYDSLSPAVNMNTCYDLASVTKVAATTLAVMKLQETGKIHLDDPISKYLPYLKRSNKEHITIRQVLSHMAGLRPFDAFWQRAGKAANPYLNVLEQVADSPLNTRSGYVYSDMGFILLGDLVGQVSGLPLDLFVQRHFYGPMGLHHTAFNPLKRGFDSLNIAPTENDIYYRQRQLQGEVHDQNAYAMGGVSGHAGLFGTADDLGAILQMLENGGTYNGRQYLRPETIQTFNTRYYEGCRRALGFDKPLPEGTEGTPCAEVSDESFGHTGFTGTMVWVDPVKHITFIFLCNRVYPDVSNNVLTQRNIRTRLQHQVYQALADE